MDIAQFNREEAEKELRAAYTFSSRFYDKCKKVFPEIDIQEKQKIGIFCFYQFMPRWFMQWFMAKYGKLDLRDAITFIQGYDVFNEKLFYSEVQEYFNKSFSFPDPGVNIPTPTEHPEPKNKPITDF